MHILSEFAHKNRWIILVVAGAILLFFIGLGHFAFKDYDEATYAQVFLETSRSGDFLNLTREGGAWIDKPPLLFWLVYPFALLFGATEFTLRIPGALLGLLSIILVFFFSVRFLDDKRVAVLASTVLATTGEFIYSARELRFDVPVAAALFLALYCFVRGWEKNIWYFGMGAAIAAAILFKGVVALLFIPLCIVWSFVFRTWHWLKNPLFYGGIVVALVLAAPWHIYEYYLHGTYFFNAYFSHMLTRVVDPILGNAQHGILYYPKYLLALAFPWSVLLIPFIVWIFSRIVKLKFKFDNLDRYEQFALASLGSFFVVIGGFSLSTTKLFPYIDPAYPFIAMGVASMLVRWVEYIKISYKNTAKIIIGALIISGLAGTLIQISEFKDGLRFGEYGAAQDAKEIVLQVDDDTAQFMYTSNYHRWDTIRYYLYTEKKKISIGRLAEPIDSRSFYLVIPSDIIAAYELGPEIAKRATQLYQGKFLTLFLVK